MRIGAAQNIQVQHVVELHVVDEAASAFAQHLPVSALNWAFGGTVHTVARAGRVAFVGGRFNAVASRHNVTGGFAGRRQHESARSGAACARQRERDRGGQRAAGSWRYFTLSATSGVHNPHLRQTGGSTRLTEPGG
jgi:hypothetical protein